jgi:DNA-binding HxlR family transcriptional regulator
VLREAGNQAAPTGEVLHPRACTTWTPLARTLAATGDHWTLMIALALAPGRMRLTHLHRRLPGVSTGVLERYLQQMVAFGLVRRMRFKEMPPRVELELTGAGRELLPIAEALARWGMRHLWSAPHERERVDVDAMLRLLPALLEGETCLPEGSVEAIIATDTDPPVHRMYRTDGGRLRMIERVANPDDPAREENGDADPPAIDPGPDRKSTKKTCLEGDDDAWIAALGPTGDYERLRITGDKRLAKRILDALPRSA